METPFSSVTVLNCLKSCSFLPFIFSLNPGFFWAKFERLFSISTNLDHVSYFSILRDNLYMHLFLLFPFSLLVDNLNVLAVLAIQTTSLISHIFSYQLNQQICFCLSAYHQLPLSVIAFFTSSSASFLTTLKTDWNCSSSFNNTATSWPNNILTFLTYRCC